MSKCCEGSDKKLRSFFRMRTHCQIFNNMWCLTILLTRNTLKNNWRVSFSRGTESARKGSSVRIQTTRFGSGMAKFAFLVSFWERSVKHKNSILQRQNILREPIELQREGVGIGKLYVCSQPTTKLLTIRGNFCKVGRRE